MLSVRYSKVLIQKSLFVVTTPVVAINNDDVEAVVDELHEEYNIPVVPVYSDGFRSKTGITGYDVALHAMLKNLLPRTAKNNVKGNFHKSVINIGKLKRS